MLIDSPQITETSTIINATVANGSTDPLNPSVGELFYRTDLGAIRVYTGAAWVEVGAVSLAAHAADATLHLSSAQNTLLDGLNLPTLTSANLNFLTGLTQNVASKFTAIDGIDATQNFDIATLQSQFSSQNSTLNAHIADGSVHLSSAQNTLLDGLSGSLTSVEVNYLVGVTSPIQTQLNTLSTGKFDKVGGTISGGVVISGLLDMANNRITGLAAPIATNDAVTKGYVDAIQQGISWKLPVVAATTTNITLSGAQTLDSVSVVAGDRVLVKNQTTASQNGIYVVAAGAWSRSTDADLNSELENAAVFIQQGLTLSDSGWVQTNSAASIGAGFTGSQQWVQFTTVGGVSSAGSGILISGNTISVRAGSGLTFGTPTTNDLTISGTTNFTFSGSQLDLSNTGVVAATFGSVSAVPSVTVDAKGRVTTASNAISIASANTANSVVSRDGSGNFSAGTITAALSGNATTATTFQTARTIALTGAATGTATSFNGSANITIPVTDLNASNLSAGTVPAARLAGTYAISISGNAATLGGFAASTAVAASTIPVRDANAYTYFNYINSNTGNSENPAISQVIVTNGTDDFYRKASIAHLTSSLSGIAPINISGNAGTATTLQTARTINGTPFNGSANITITSNTPNAITFNNGGSGDASGTTFNGSTSPTISYNTIGSPSTTGANASGTWSINITGTAGSTTTVVGAPASLYSTSVSTSYSTAVQMREANVGGAQGGAAAAAPRLAFHWGGLVASSICIEPDGTIAIRDNPGTSYEKFHAGATTVSTLNGFTPSSGILANRLVATDGNGYIFGNYTNMTDEGTSGTSGSVTGIITKRGDNYYRTTSAQSVATFLSGSSMNIAGNATTASNGGVTSFNSRTGAITLTPSDVTSALGYTPGSGSGTVTSVTVAAGSGLTGGGTVTTSGTITLNLGYTVTPTAGVASRIVQADGSGFINNTYFNSTDNIQSSGVTAVLVKAGDDYHRSGTAQAIATFLSGSSMNISGNATTASNGGVTSVTGGTGVSASPTTGAVVVSIGQAVGTGNSPTFAGLTLNGAITSFAATAPSSVVFGATTTLTCTASNVFYVGTLTGNITSFVLNSPTDGQTINVFFTQDATGSRTIAWPSSFKWAGGTAGVLSTAANAVDMLVATYRSSTGFWYASLSKAFS